MATLHIALRSGETAQARRLHALISANLEEGHLLPRTLGDLTAHAGRFVVATRGRRVVGCAELAPLSPLVAEVRSLAVDRSERNSGIGRQLVETLRLRARREGYEKLCAFTHSPAYFIQMGFSIVPHLWLSEKVFTDCVKCPQFRRCGQYAMVIPLDCADEASVGTVVPADAPPPEIPAQGHVEEDEPLEPLTEPPGARGVLLPMVPPA